MRVVLDTNVLISALIKGGKRWELLSLLSGERMLILSREILQEFLNVSEDPEIKRYASEEDTVSFLDSLRGLATLVKVKSAFRVVKEDPDDDVILRAAVDGKADYIVSGDKHLLSLAEFRGIKIVTVDEMLTILK